MTGLDPEQEQTLVTIVEVVRSVPRTERHAFFLSQTLGGAFMLMPGAKTQHARKAKIVREWFSDASIHDCFLAGASYNMNSKEWSW